MNATAGTSKRSEAARKAAATRKSRAYRSDGASERKEYAPGEIKFSLFAERAPESTGDPIANAQQAYEMLKDTMANSPQEMFMVGSLDQKHRVIRWSLTSLGTINATLAHPREIFRSAIIDNAKAIILAHNHPSGDTSPSNEDIQTTGRLLNAGQIIGIEILDHIIIGRNGWTSLRETGNF